MHTPQNLSSRLMVLALPMLTCLLVSPALRAAEDQKEESGRRVKQVAAALADIDANVLPADQREAAASMVSQNVRSRIQAANDKSSRLWREIKTRDEWERFRDQHVEALRTSLARFPEPPKKLNAHTTGTVKGDGYTIDNVVYETRPGLW